MNFSKRTKALTVSMLLEQRRRKKKTQQRSFLTTSRNLLVGFGILASVLLMTAILYGAYAVTRLNTHLPSLAEISVLLDPQEGMILQPTQFLDRTGQVILYTLENPGVERRILKIDPANPEHFSPQLVHAMVAYLEPNFWSGPGVSWRNLTELEPQTIAEELVNSLLFEKEIDIQDALRMRLLAAQTVSKFGRAQVLEWYLNSAYFGHMAFGADQAAQLYLGKFADQLNLAEACLLISLLDTPTLNPLDAPQAALERKDEVLLELNSTGLFSPNEIEQALAAKIDFVQTGDRRKEGFEFADYALNQLATEMNLLHIQRGGFRVVTTIDAAIQEQLTCTARVQIKRLEGDPDAGITEITNCEAALLLPTLKPGGSPLEHLAANGLVLDPQNGEILAWSGIQDAVGTGSFTGAYQPGSLLTPFVAAAAFARGLSPASLVWDAPKSTDTEEAALIVTNPDGVYHGPQRVRYALANDYLVAMTQLFQQVGGENIRLLAQTLGLKSIQQTEPSILMAGGNLYLLEIAQAYSTFSNLGVQTGWASSSPSPQPVSILRVETTDGRVIFEKKNPQSQAVLSPGLAYLVHDILSDEIARQQSLGFPNALDIGRPAGAKVGQTSTANQVWTVGYTPSHLTVIWLGFVEDELPADETILKPEMAAGIWHAVMQHSMKDLPIQDWRQPPDVITRTVCSPSGQLPTADCPLKVEEIFLMGSEPITVDSLYKTYAINLQTGKLATVFTPLGSVVEETFLVPPPAYQEWAIASGLRLPPTDYDLIQAPKPLPGVEITSPEPFSHINGQITIRGTAGGEDFESYRLQIGEGLNPRTWLQIGEESTKTITRGILGTWDTIGLNGLYVIRLTVLRDENRLESHVIQVSVDNTMPIAAITYPKQGQEISFNSQEDLIFLADASDSIGIDQLVWVLDGKMIGESTLAPYYLAWGMVRGEHRLRVDAYDLAGNITESEEISFSIK